MYRNYHQAPRILTNRDRAPDFGILGSAAGHTCYRPFGGGAVSTSFTTWVCRGWEWNLSALDSNALIDCAIEAVLNVLKLYQEKREFLSQQLWHEEELFSNSYSIC